MKKKKSNPSFAWYFTLMLGIIMIGVLIDVIMFELAYSPIPGWIKFILTYH